jgi:hypothetical protein
MKKNIISIFSLSMILACMFLTACEKDKAALAPAETYLLKGRIEPTFSNIPATLTSANFTITYNFGDAQSVLNGSLKLAGYSYTGSVTARDTCSFFAIQPSGPAISYITAVTTAANTNSTTNNLYFNYFNGAAATFNITNYPFSNEITSLLKDGAGFFRIGSNPKYIYIFLDEVTKL